LVALPPTASLKALVRPGHQRWAIEQQYQELTTELGLDHFEGRSYSAGTDTSC
jgi:SRSO17 transposase